MTILCHFVILRNNVTKNLSLNDRKARFFAIAQNDKKRRLVILEEPKATKDLAYE